MSTPRFPSRIATIAIVIMLTLSSVQTAFATPANVNFADAMLISSLPYSVNQDTLGATFEADEPYPSCGYGYSLQTAWFTYTPSTNTSLTARANYYYFPPILAIYTGTSLGSLTQIACGNWYSQLTFQAQGGVTYYFQVSGLYGDQGTPSASRLDLRPKWTGTWHLRLFDLKGRELPCQEEQPESLLPFNGWRRKVVFYADLPALGVARYRLELAEGGQKATVGHDGLDSTLAPQPLTHVLDPRRAW